MASNPTPSLVPKPVGPSGATTKVIPVPMVGESFGGPGLNPSTLNTRIKDL